MCNARRCVLYAPKLPPAKRRKPKLTLMPSAVGSTRLKKHSHGHLYRVKIAPFSGPIEYGEWFQSEALLRAAMSAVGRDIGKRYYCEAMSIRCAECEVDEKPQVIAAL
jgi:hypothetical protein